MKKMSTDNLLRMLASLILGMLLWVYAVSDSNPMTTQNYSALEIHYTGQDSLSSNHLMLQSQTSSINVTLYGRSQQLGKIKSANSAPDAFCKSCGASSTCEPSFPPLTTIVDCASAD